MVTTAPPEGEHTNFGFEWPRLLVRFVILRGNRRLIKPDEVPMGTRAGRPDDPGRELACLLEGLDRAYDRTSWHGPNLRGSLRGVTAAEASWRPRPDRHNVAEQALHAAYWKYIVRRRLCGGERGSFPVKGSNWFPAPVPLVEREWQRYLAVLDEQHRALREAVAGLDPNGLDQVPGSGKGRFTRRAMVLGVAAHDVYHAGQIQFLRRLQGRSGPR
jgi:hypothetical protein